jgi:hypothetical protein
MLLDIIKHIDAGLPYANIGNLLVHGLIYSILYKDNYRRISRDSKCQTFDPFLPPMDKKYQYTLVLDLDETLVHYLPVIFFKKDSQLFYFIYSAVFI